METKQQIVLKIKRTQKRIRDLIREYDMIDLELAENLLTKKSLEEVYDDMMMELAMEQIKVDEVKENWEKLNKTATKPKANRSKE